MADAFRDMCAELLADYDNCHYRSELSDRAHSLLDQPEPEDRSQISDGYHTFAELYAHRHALMLALMRAMPGLCWFSQRHSDGGMPFGSADWFIVGAHLPTGAITYHLPIESLPLARQTGAAERAVGCPWDGHTASDVIERLRGWASTPQPEPAELTDEELRELRRKHDWPVVDSLLFSVARAVLAADRARRPTPHSPVDGEAVEVLQWPAEWSRKQRAQEAEMLCCSAGMTPGKETQQIVEDARDGMPLQHLHDLISHAIPTPQPPVDGEVAELVEWSLREADYQEITCKRAPCADRIRRVAYLLERQHPQPVPVSERPWEREGWCDEEGRCWYGATDRPGAVACWDLDYEPATDDTHSLPANALPTPEAKT